MSNSSRLGKVDNSTGPMILPSREMSAGPALLQLAMLVVFAHMAS